MTTPLIFTFDVDGAQARLLFDSGSIEFTPDNLFYSPDEHSVAYGAVISWTFRDILDTPCAEITIPALGMDVIVRRLDDETIKFGESLFVGNPRHEEIEIVRHSADRPLEPLIKMKNRITGQIALISATAYWDQRTYCVHVGDGSITDVMNLTLVNHEGTLYVDLGSRGLCIIKVDAPELVLDTTPGMSDWHFFGGHHRLEVDGRTATLTSVR